MPNLVLTYQCDNGCPFCFVSSKANDEQLTLEQMREMLPFLASFNEEGITLLGGEPTGHGQLPEIMQLLMDEGYQVQLFSNGRFPATLMNDLHTGLRGDFSICLNRSRPEIPQDLETLYRTLGYCIQLSVTIFKSGQNLDHLLREIHRFKLNKIYRLGIALPVWPDNGNQAIHPDQYRIIADELFQAIMYGCEMGLRPTFDCGFPLCFFTPEQRQLLGKRGVDFKSHCGIIPDITPSGTAIPCFPLSRFAKPIHAVDTWPLVENDLLQQLDVMQRSDLFPACADCPDAQTGACSGGCLAWRLRGTKCHQSQNSD